jgi:PAS domain S-box-containing protein
VVAGEGTQSDLVGHGFYEQLLGHMHDAVIVVRPDGSIHYGVEHVRRLLDLGPEQPGPDHLLERLHPDDRANVVRNMERREFPALQGPVLQRALAGDGTYRWLEVTASMAADLPIGGMILVLRDVSDRISDAHRTRELLDTLSEGIISLDLHGVVLSCNHRFAEMHGLRPDDLLGRRWREVIEPEDSAAVDAQVLRAQAGDPGPFIQRHRRPDGTMATTTFRIRRLTDEHGTPTGYAASVTDVGELLEMRAALAEASAARDAAAERERQLVGLLGEGVILWAGDGTVAEANPRACAMAGLEPGGLVGLAYRDLFTSVDGTDHYEVGKRAAEDDPGPYQRLLRRADGSTLAVQARVTVLDSPEGPQYLGVYTDVSNLDDARCELRDALDEARATNEARRHFLSRVSHELRTPLGPVVGFSELLLADLGDEHVDLAEARNFARLIHDSGRSLQHLVDDLLDLSRIDVGELRIDPVPVDLRERCQVVAARAAVRDTDHAIRLPDTPAIVLADPARLDQILANLVGNAQRYARTDIDLRVEGFGQRVRCAVVDHGPGIPAARRDQVFEPFVRLESSLEGTGLGLPIARHLAEAMGGSLTVEPTPGGGATFVLELPAA